MQPIGVLRGGIGDEYDVSLKTGAAVLSALRSQGHKPIDILVTRDGTWHIAGIPIDPKELGERTSLVWNALHGVLGEDGSVQEFFDANGIAYTGSRGDASEAFLNKVRAKEVFKKFDLKTPPYEYVPAYDDTVFAGTLRDYAVRNARLVWQTFAPPWVIKPLASGSSCGVYLARTFDELASGLESALEKGGDFIVEEFISGKEVTLGIVQDFRGVPHYTLIPKEVSKRGAILSYDERLSGDYIFRALSRHEEHLKQEMTGKMSHLFEWLGLRHYATADFILSPRGLYILEIDTLPALHPEASFARGLGEVGAGMPEFVTHIIKVAQNQK